jgi:hypothetical protein
MGLSLLAVAALMWVAACSGGAGGTGREGTAIDETQAYRRAEEHLCAAVAALGIEVRLIPGLRNSVPMKGLFGQETGLVNVEISYGAELPSEGEVFERNRGVFQRLHDWWRGQGYQIVRYDASEPFTVLVVVDPRDGFTVSLRQGKIGNLWLTVGSPWVTATGVKPPEAHGCSGAPRE